MLENRMDFRVGQTVKLIPKTSFGKNRIKRDGDTFVIDRLGESIPCLNSAGIFVIPPNGNSRWVAIPTDRDFMILV